LFLRVDQLKNYHVVCLQLSKTLEQVNGDQGGEVEFAEVKDLGVYKQK